MRYTMGAEESYLTVFPVKFTVQLQRESGTRLGNSKTRRFGRRLQKAKPVSVRGSVCPCLLPLGPLVLSPWNRYCMQVSSNLYLWTGFQQTRKFESTKFESRCNFTEYGQWDSSAPYVFSVACNKSNMNFKVCASLRRGLKPAKQMFHQRFLSCAHSNSQQDELTSVYVVNKIGGYTINRKKRGNVYYQIKWSLKNHIYHSRF